MTREADTLAIAAEGLRVLIRADQNSPSTIKDAVAAVAAATRAYREQEKGR